MLRLLLETLFNILRMMAMTIDPQKFTLYTSDLMSSKVISNGEPTASRSLVTNFPSTSIFSANQLLWTLCKSADMDNLCAIKDDAYRPGTIARHNASRDLIAMNIKTKTQKLILYTSDVAHAKVIITGELITPSSLVTAPPSMDDLSAGVSRAHTLLRAQLVTLQRHLRAPVDLDNLRIGNSDVYGCDSRLMAPCPSVSKCYAFRIESTMPYPRLAVSYKLCIMTMMQFLTVVIRSLLAH